MFILTDILIIKLFVKIIYRLSTSNYRLKVSSRLLNEFLGYLTDLFLFLLNHTLLCSIISKYHKLKPNKLKKLELLI